jgi:uroporphyrin-III C-methyltransferase/precorrin-2 dehydrogenase/sirohydrochlorin ferrochelatase
MNKVFPMDGTAADGGLSRRELTSLPIFLTLAGKRALVAGGSTAALWKAELLQAAGARVDIYSAAPCEGLIALGAQNPKVRLLARDFEPGDFEGAALAIADARDTLEASAFQAAARAAGVLINMIDRPEFCDFQFGAILDRSPLVIGISTSGAAPMLAQSLRGRLQGFLPQNLGSWVKAARGWRQMLFDQNVPDRLRRRFWDIVSRRALDARAMPPSGDDFARILDEATKGGGAGSRGSVALVGAGPGDPELLTLKALRVLQSADAVLYDDLVSPAIVDMARREAEKICVGKRGYRPSCQQDHIVSLLIELALAGKRVVRLKGGDPMIFGRANEEIAGLEAAGIPVEVVPGVTAALGAAASLNVSLTERDRARRLQFITAHAHDGKLPDDIDWRALADPRASSVVYMGARTLGSLAARLLAQGIDPDTPAILVERATLPDERTVIGTIETLPGKVADLNPEGPCLILFGPAFGISLRRLGVEETLAAPA